MVSEGGHCSVSSVCLPQVVACLYKASVPSAAGRWREACLPRAAALRAVPLVTGFLSSQKNAFLSFSLFCRGDAAATVLRAASAL